MSNVVNEEECKWGIAVLLSSIPLWKYENDLPVANASGCLVDYFGGRFLLSVAHATIAESEWRMEIKTMEEFEGQMLNKLQPITMNSLSQFKMLEKKGRFTKPKIAEFTYKMLPGDLNSTHVVADSGNLWSADRTIFAPSFKKKPNKNMRYGFYGQTRFRGVVGNSIICKPRLEKNLKYVGKQGDYFKFELPHKYGSHENYLGCSGAPIIDEENNVVALVTFGEKSSNCIFGIDISKYRAVLEIDTKNII